MSSRTFVAAAVLPLALALGVAACEAPRADGSSSARVDHRALVANGGRLIDVRTPEEFAEGHVNGAVNIPVADLGARLGEAGPKDKAVVVYCRSGNRSAQAARLLRDQGYTQVVDIGPMSAW